MTQEQKDEILFLRDQGVTYSQIADYLGLKTNTVKAFYRRNKMRPEKNIKQIPPTASAPIVDGEDCKQCGQRLIQEHRSRPKKFCNELCRRTYWTNHRDAMKKRMASLIECACCGKYFESNESSTRVYCSHSCYITARFRQSSITRSSKTPEVQQYLELLKDEELPAPAFDDDILPAMDESLPMLPIRAAREDEKLQPKRVFLLAGPSSFQGKYDHFIGLVPHIAQDRLMAGDVFVCCNAQRTQLSILQWHGDGFALFFKRLEYGRYPWPIAFSPKLIEVPSADLRLLMEIPYFIRRISDLSTE